MMSTCLESPSEGLRMWLKGLIHPVPQKKKRKSYTHANEEDEQDTGGQQVKLTGFE